MRRITFGLLAGLLAIISAQPALSQETLVPPPNALAVTNPAFKGTLSGPAASIGNLFGSSAQSTNLATGSTTPRTLGDMAADSFNVKNYGAKGDGNVRTIASTLGITTLAGLKAYKVNGATPYANFGVYPLGNYSALPVLATSAAGSTTLIFYTTLTIGGPSFASMSVGGIIPTGATFLPIGTGNVAWVAGATYSTIGQEVVANGNVYSLLNPGNANTTGTGPSGGYNQYGILDGTAIWQYVSAAPPDLISLGMANVKPGMHCIVNGPLNYWTIGTINPAASVIQLANGLGTTAPLSKGQTITCGFDISNIAVGATAGGLNQSSSFTVTAVNNNPGLETLTISPALPSATGQFTTWQFWWPWTDAQIASGSMDWADVQATYEAASTTGGKVVIPAGTYAMNLNVVIPQSAQIDTEGSGVDNTVLQWTQDLGYGASYVANGSRLSGYEQRDAFSGLRINGPTINNVMGSSAENSCGLAVNGYKTVSNVEIDNTFAAICNNGGQSHFRDVLAQNNYYGIYFDTADTVGNFGSNLYENIQINGGTMAGIACTVGYCDPGSSWIRTIVAGFPYVAMLETYGVPGAIAAPNGNAGLFLDHDKFENFQAEQTGMCGFCDDRPAGQSVSVNLETIWEHYEPSWNTANSIPFATGQNSATMAEWEMGTCDDCHIITPTEIYVGSSNWAPGSDGIIDILNSRWFEFKGNVDDLIATAAASSKPVLSNNMNPRNWVFYGNGWQGRACLACGYSAAGTILASPPAGGALATSTGTAGEVVFGVSRGGYAQQQNTIIATAGMANVTLGAAITGSGGNLPLRTAASGQAVQASGSNVTTSPYIGWTYYGTTASGSSVPVYLRLGGP